MFDQAKLTSANRYLTLALKAEEKGDLATMEARFAKAVELEEMAFEST